MHGGIEDLRGLVPELTDEDVARVSMGPYTAEDFRRHLLAVTKGEVEPELMEALISQSRPTVDWMCAKGVRWELPAGIRPSAGAPSVIPNSVGLSAWGSGPGLVDSLTRAARRQVIDMLYETRMARLLQGSNGRVHGVVAEDARR